MSASPQVTVAVPPPKPLGISTPSRPRPSATRTESLPPPSTVPAPAAATAPPQGYSYLSRSSSISTPTRSRPRGLTSSTSSSILASPVLVTRPSLTDLKQPAKTKGADHISRRNTMHSMPSSFSLPQFPPPPATEAAKIAEAVSKLPTNPKMWTPSQVALYLTHVLGLVPRPIVEDVTAYVRSSHMGGRAFLRLSEKDLELQGLNLKWRRLMIEAVRKLRRDALRGRIWGNESGSIKWPRKHDQQDDESDSQGKDGVADDDDTAVTQDGVVKSSKGVSKLTLKRMRESKKVQGMIQAFQLSPRSEEKAGLTEEDMVALGIDQIRKGHAATKPGSGRPNGLGSPRKQIPPVFGEGYVRDQAESYESAPDRPLPSRSSSAVQALRNSGAGDEGHRKNDILDELFASVTESEAAELASELDLDDLRDPDRRSSFCGDLKLNLGSRQLEDEVALVPRLDCYARERKGKEGSDGSSASLCSGTSDSEMEMEDLIRMQDNDSRFGLLDADVIKSIIGDAGEDGDASVRTSGSIRKRPDAASGLTRSRTTGSLARPERPYRASLYTTEELLLLEDGASQIGIHPRTESSAELAEGLCLDTQEHPFLSSAKFGTTKKRSAATVGAVGALKIDGLFSVDAGNSAGADKDTAAATPAVPALAPAAVDEYIFDPPPSSLSRSTSMRKKASGTYGSKRGKVLLSMLQNANDIDDPALLDSALVPNVGSGSVRLRKKRSTASAAAEDEEGWGGTLSRPSSRRSLNSIYLGGEGASKTGSVASRIGSVALRRRPLERVASEAEAEAWHEALDKAQAQMTSEEEEQDGEEDKENKESAPKLEQEEKEKVQEDEKEKVQEQEKVAEAQIEGEAAEAKEDGVAATSEPQSSELASGLADERPSSQNDGKAAAAADVAEVQEAKPAAKDGAKVNEVQEARVVETSVAVEAPETASVAAGPAAAVGDAMTPPEAVSSSPPASTAAPADSLFATIADASAASEAARRPSQDAATLGGSDQMLVPLTTLSPHPSGTGSIRKRSMVLVDRKRFESLARKMEKLETQISQLESQTHASRSSSSSSAVGASSQRRALQDLFDPCLSATDEEECREKDEYDHQHPGELADNKVDGVDEGDAAVAAASKSGRFSLFHPSSWTRYLSSINPYYHSTAATSDEDDEEDDEEITQDESEALSLGAIPAYMLGLGAGVGFVMVREVVAAGLLRR
ncbi:hypothetical protein ACQY0O_001602 [Thecaphora frezii]